MSWQKQILRVNLTNSTVAIEPLNMEWAEDYLGERGLASKYLLDGMDARADSMSPENMLIFATAANRHHGFNQRPLYRCHQRPVDRRYRLLKLRWKIRSIA